MIEQIRRCHQQHRFVLIQTQVGNRSGEMRLATAICPLQYQPALWLARVSISHLVCGTEGCTLLRRQIRQIKGEILEGFICKDVQIADFAQGFEAFLIDSAMIARTTNQLAKIRMSDRQIDAYVAEAATNGARLGVIIRG